MGNTSPSFLGETEKRLHIENKKMLYDEISTIIDSTICDTPETFRGFKQRVEESAFTRDENPQSHFCVYFLPYNPATKEVFITHHKKSGLWISPGGHIDEGEKLLETLNREIKEELGMRSFFQEEQNPFLLSITPIENKTQPCKLHFDIWYLVETNGSNFQVDPTEFHDTKWMTILEAQKIVTDGPNKKALELLSK